MGRKHPLCAISPFSTGFSKDLYCRHVKEGLAWERVKLQQFFTTTQQIYPNSLFNPFPNKPWFLHVCSTSLLETLWKKEKLLVTSNFSISYSVFYPFGGLSTIFIKIEIVVCKLFEFGQV